MRKSIFAKYFTTVAVIILASVVIFSSIVLMYFRGIWKNNKEELLLRNVKIISQVAVDSDYLQIQSIIEVVGEIIDADIFIVDETGQCIYSTDNSGKLLQTGEFIDKDILLKTTKGKYEEIGTMNNEFSIRSFIIGYPIKSQDVKVGAVFAAVPMKQSDIYIASVLNTMVYAAVIVMLIAFIVSYVTSAQMTRPLRKMAQAVRKIESGDFAVRISVDRRDEIGLLAEAINKMLVSIGELEGMRRNFISSVSHELKTPMTTISGFVDGILDGTISKEESDRYLRIVSDETKRLSRLVNSMLQLSRLESEEMKLNKTTFNLSDMIISVFLSFEQKIESKKIEICGLDMLKPISLTADRDLIYQVVYNLTENAIKFTPENGKITINCEGKKQVIEFSIKNTGEGLQQREMARIFDRFYKTDRSRSKDKTGMGFGLYIVKTIVGLHGGKITVGSVVGEYTQFNVVLPDSEVIAEIDNHSIEKRNQSKKQNKE